MPAKKILRIGEKISAGDDIHLKRFKNGHKCFTASEAKAVIECQKAERRTAENFQNNMMIMTRSRDPTTGEATPRDDAPGRPIIEPHWLSMEFKQPKTVSITGKIGVPPYRDGERPQHEPLKNMQSLRYLQDNITGELDFLQRKLANSGTKLQQSINRNRRSLIL